MQRIVYSRGFPFGAPALYVRGGATRMPEVREHLKSLKARWDGTAHAWVMYGYADEATKILTEIRDRFGVDIVPKDGLDEGLVLQLPEETE